MFGKKTKEKKLEEERLKKEHESMQNLRADALHLDLNSGKKSLVVPEPPQDVKVELSDEEKALLALLKEYDAYRGIFTFQEYANLPRAAVESENATLLFAVFCELRKLREDVQDLSKTIKEMGA